MAFICERQIVIQSQNKQVDSILAIEPAFPEIDDTCTKCFFNGVVSDPEDDSSCEETDDHECHTKEVCGEQTYQDSDGNWIFETKTCEPRCPLPMTVYNEETQVCDQLPPPLTCEEKLVPHVDRESEVENRYFLQQTIMIEQNERHYRQLNRMHRLNERKWRQDATLEEHNNYTISLTNREITLIDKFALVDLRRINLNTAWVIQQEEQRITEEILRQELEMVINREITITHQETTLIETVRILAETVGVCPMPEDA